MFTSRRTTLLLLPITVLWALQAKPQSTCYRNVQQAITRMLDGVSNRDMLMIRRNTTPDFLILEDGHLYTLDSVTKHLAHAKKAASYHRINHLFFATTRVEGNAAWVAFTDIAAITINGKTTTENFLESAYLTKINGAWKVQMIHSITVTSYIKLPYH
jgi:hypothetical protein